METEGDTVDPSWDPTIQDTAYAQEANAKTFKGAPSRNRERSSKPFVRRPPPGGYAFERDDSVISAKLPPSPCKICGSPKHWDPECPHYSEYQVKRKVHAIGADQDVPPEVDEEYLNAYVATVLMRADDDNTNSVHHLSWGEYLFQEGERLKVKAQQVSRLVASCEEILDQEGEAINALPPDSPSLLEEITKPENEKPMIPKDTFSRHRTVSCEEEVDCGGQSVNPLPADHPSLLEGPESEDNVTGIPPWEAKLDQTEASAYVFTASAGSKSTPSSVEKEAVTGSRTIIRMKKKRDPPAGHSTRGISALSFLGPIGHSSMKPIRCRLDSGADISLISEDCLLSIPERFRPKIRQGIRLNLYQLTKGFKITGFVKLPVYAEDNQGRVLEFEAECYVVPGMISPLLLGEDFQVNYELSVRRLVDSGSSVRFVRTKTHRRNQKKRRREKARLRSPHIRASEDLTI
ncbi:hypothetical protein K474DRAFT_1609880 [Panus rudis PR-1116 ss-1]|nr:hypothetical protein K474DRAFT_1609880 [Panus rudis PR-1116 ss-1]